MDHNTFIIISLVQSVRIAFGHTNRQYLEYKKACEGLWQKMQTLTQENLALREGVKELNKRLHKVYSIAISLHNNSYTQHRLHEELQSQYENLQSQYKDLQSQYADLQSQATELKSPITRLVKDRRKIIQDLDAAVRRAQKAERKLQRRDQKTHDKIQGSSAVNEGVARIATGRVLTVKNSFLNAGSESTDPKECGAGSEQGPISSGPSHNNRRQKLARKGKMLIITLEIPKKGT
jgi:chromosome segregation ATPase